jgi:hypothetical protein
LLSLESDVLMMRERSSADHGHPPSRHPAGPAAIEI